MAYCNECADELNVICYCHTCYNQLRAENARLKIAEKHASKEYQNHVQVIADLQAENARLRDLIGISNDYRHEIESVIRAEALKDAANRAVLCWFESDPHEDPLNIAKRLRAAILAGEVKNG
jgi:hypothetical protein